LPSVKKKGEWGYKGVSETQILTKQGKVWIRGATKKGVRGIVKSQSRKRGGPKKGVIQQNGGHVVGSVSKWGNGKKLPVR